MTNGLDVADCSRDPVRRVMRPISRVRKVTARTLFHMSARFLRTQHTRGVCVWSSITWSESGRRSRGWTNGHGLSKSIDEPAGNLYADNVVRTTEVILCGGGGFKGGRYDPTTTTTTKCRRRIRLLGIFVSRQTFR